MAYTDLESKLVARAMKDQEFRRELQNNPASAIKKELGVEVPPGVTVRVHADSPGTFNIVLPMAAEAQPQAPAMGTFGGITWSASGTACPNCG